MGFGFGMSDFLAVFELAVRVRDRWIDSPKEYKTIKDETKNIENILQDIGELGTRVDLGKQHEADFKQACQSCYEVLQECEKLVNKYSSVQSTTGGRFKIRRAWARLQVDPDDIRHLREQLSAQITQLGLLHDIIETDLVIEIREGVQDLRLSDVERQRTIVADWYSPTDFADQQTDQLSRRHIGTGGWFLARAEYRHWRQEANSTLLCPGIPGSGKSVMAATIVEDLQLYSGASKDVVIAYLYCNFNRQMEQDLGRMLATLTRQLFQEQGQPPDPVMALYTKHRDRATRPSVGEIRDVLRLLVSSYRRVFVVVDALDECGNTQQQRDYLLDELFSLQRTKGNNINVLATTRFIPTIIQQFSGCQEIEIRADESDIRVYLASHMTKLAKFVSQDTQLQEKMKCRIVNAAEGMFLLARLQFDSLRDKTNSGHMEEALAQFETGSGALDGEYAKVIDRIDCQLPGWRNLARRAILWITYATRELSINELREAIAIDPKRKNVGLHNYLDDEDQIVSVCQGLVEVDRESQVVRLVHYTTQKYFEKIRDQWLPEGHLTISRSCIAYLSMNVFMHSRCRWEMDLLSTIEQHSFLRYAGKNWGLHARIWSGEELNDEIIDFLDNTEYLRFASQVTFGEASYWQDEYRCYTSEISAVHVSCHFNLRGVLEKLIQEGEDINRRDSDRRTPLFRAAESGHIDTIQLLLAQPAIEINAKDKYGFTPLSHAAQGGQIDAIQLLLTCPGLELNARDWDGDTPLSRAARGGRTKIVQLLLAQPGIEVNVKNNFGRTSLSHAAQRGHTEIVHLLLSQPSIEIITIDVNGRTPHSRAAQRGYMDIVQLLLTQPGIKSDTMNMHGVTPPSPTRSDGYSDIELELRNEL